MRLEVEEGFSDGDDVEITILAGGSLAPGEPVVVVGKDLEDGDEVTFSELDSRGTTRAELEASPADRGLRRPATPDAAASTDP